VTDVRQAHHGPVIVFLVACLSAANLTPVCGRAGNPPKTPAARAAVTFDSGRAFEHVRQLVAIGPRPAGSPGIETARRYISDQMKAVGLSVVEQRFEAATPLGPVKMANLRVTVPGASRDRLIIGGHYDTKLFREFRFVGANDAGSSTAFLIEIARVIKARQNALTIELIFFDGEEATLRDWGGTDHTYGSQFYVDNGRKTGTLSGLKAMVLVDMIGERSPRFMREANSTPWLTDIIWSTAQKLGHGSVFVNASTPIEDDHVPFLKAGVPSADIIDLDYPEWHGPGDTLDQTSARSLQVVGDVVLASLAPIEARLAK